MRRTFISMTWTPDVSPEDARLLIGTLEQVYDHLRPLLGVPGQFDPLPDVRIFGAWAIPAVPAHTAYRSIAWMLDHSLNDARTHIQASRYIRVINLEPWQATFPHFDLALTDLPIVDDRSSAPRHQDVIGVGRRGLVSLISTRRFHHIRGVLERGLALQHTFGHYIGQMFDVPAPHRRASLVEQDGEVYCGNVCVMRFTDTPEMALHWGLQEAAEGVAFCEECERDLLSSIVGFHYGLN